MAVNIKVQAKLALYRGRGGGLFLCPKMWLFVCLIKPLEERSIQNLNVRILKGRLKLILQYSINGPR